MGLVADAGTYSGIMDAYYNAQDWVSAAAVLSEMKRRGVRPTAETYNIALRHHIRAGKLQNVAGFLTEMKESFVAPDTHTHNLTLEAHIRSGNKEDAAALLEQLTRAGTFPNPVTLNVLASAHATARDLDGAVAWMKQLQASGGRAVDAQTYAAVVGALLEQERIAEVSDILEAAGDADVDAALYERLAEAYARMGKGADARRALMMLRKNKGKSSSAEAYGNVLQALLRQRHLLAAHAVFREMKRDETIPTCKAYTALIQAHLEHAQPDEAETLYAEMKQLDVPTDRPLFRVMVRGLCDLGRTDRALAFIDVVAQSSSVPTDVFTMVLSALIREGRGTHAEALFRKVAQYRVALDERLYSVMIGLYVSANRPDDAAELVSAMTEQGIKPSATTYSRLIAIQTMRGEGERAMSLLTDMRQRGMPLDGRAATRLAVDLLARGATEHAMQVFEEMREQKTLDALAVELFLKQCRDAKLTTELADTIVEKALADKVPFTENIADIYFGMLFARGESDRLQRVMAVVVDGQIPTDAGAFTAAMCALADAGQLSGAVDLYARAPFAGVAPTPHMTGVVVRGYAFAERFEEAIALAETAADGGRALVISDLLELVQMLLRRRRPQAEEWLTRLLARESLAPRIFQRLVAAAAVLPGLPDMVLRILEEMNRRGVKADMREHLPYLLKCISAESAARIRALAGMPPEEASGSAVVGALLNDGRLVEVEAELSKPGEAGPRGRDYGRLVAAYCARSQLDDALRVLGVAQDAKLAVPVTAYNELLRCLIAANRRPDAVRVYADIRSRNIRTNEDTYKILTRRVAKHAFQADGHLSPAVASAPRQERPPRRSWTHRPPNRRDDPPQSAANDTAEPAIDAPEAPRKALIRRDETPIRRGETRTQRDTIAAESPSAGGPLAVSASALPAPAEGSCTAAALPASPPPIAAPAARTRSSGRVAPTKNWLRHKNAAQTRAPARAPSNIALLNSGSSQAPAGAVREPHWKRVPAAAVPPASHISTSEAIVTPAKEEATPPIILKPRSVAAPALRIERRPIQTESGGATPTRDEKGAGGVPAAQPSTPAAAQRKPKETAAVPV